MINIEIVAVGGNDVVPLPPSSEVVVEEARPAVVLVLEATVIDVVTVPPGEVEAPVVVEVMVVPALGTVVLAVVVTPETVAVVISGSVVVVG